MLTFSTNSWHYRFASLRCFDIYGLDDRVVPSRNTLCGYVSMVASGLFFYILVTSLLAWALLSPVGVYMLFTGVTLDEMGGVFVPPALFGAAVIMAAGASCAIYSLNRIDRLKDKLFRRDNSQNDVEPSLIVEWFKAVKDKYCPIIELKDK